MEAFDVTFIKMWSNKRAGRIFVTILKAVEPVQIENNLLIKIFYELCNVPKSR